MYLTLAGVSFKTLFLLPLTMLSWSAWVFKCQAFRTLQVNFFVHCISCSKNIVNFTCNGLGPFWIYSLRHLGLQNVWYFPSLPKPPCPPSLASEPQLSHRSETSSDLCFFDIPSSRNRINPNCLWCFLTRFLRSIYMIACGSGHIPRTKQISRTKYIEGPLLSIEFMHQNIILDTCTRI